MDEPTKGNIAKALRDLAGAISGEVPALKENRPAQLQESALVWDNSEGKWVEAYRTDVKRFKIVDFVKAVLFNSTDETYTSDSFECAAYSKFLLLANLDVTDNPTDIYIDVQFSDDNVTWYKYMRGPFGDLRWEDSAGDKKECLDGPVIAKFMRLYLVSSGASSGSKFLMNVKAILTG